MGDTVKRYHTDKESRLYPGDIIITETSNHYAEDGTDLRDFKNADREHEKLQKQDKYVQQVKKNFEQRSQLGISKYNTTLERKDIDLLGWLNHLQEELMDATLYIERLKDETTKNS